MKTLEQNMPFELFLNKIIHEWSKILVTLGFSLVPIFFILDFFTMPQNLLPQFAVYRLTATVVPLIQYFIIKNTKPGKLSYIHGYIVSLVVGGAIVLMTIDLGGFNSRYYAGINLVIIAVNLLLPWPAIHSAINAVLLMLFYIISNFVVYQPFDNANLINNVFFMSATIIIAVCINYVRHRLIKQEFFLRNELKKARDALWGEMELAKRIQTSLLPKNSRLGNYQVAAIMKPADEVGGDYYDFIETLAGEKWIAIGDVSGHGVDSGLIMMMTQTSIFSILNQTPGFSPSKIIDYVNSVIRKNILRLDINRYMTLIALKLNENFISVAGKHMDIIIYRHDTAKVEIYPTEGTWIGISDNIADYLTDHEIAIGKFDIILLYTDGVTEAINSSEELYGEEKLIESFQKHSSLNVGDMVNSILNDVLNYQSSQTDDVTIVVVKRIF